MSQANFISGHALRCRSARPGRHEEQSARGGGVSLVGGKPMQVWELSLISVTAHFG